MAQTPHTVHVKVEIDYERLSQAIRDALRASTTVTTLSNVGPQTAEDVAEAIRAREAWEKA